MISDLASAELFCFVFLAWGWAARAAENRVFQCHLGRVRDSVALLLSASPSGVGRTLRDEGDRGHPQTGQPEPRAILAQVSSSRVQLRSWARRLVDRRQARGSPVGDIRRVLCAPA